MAKLSTSKAIKGQSEPQVQLDKEQKRQAKRETKLKLKIELMQKNIRKAERKVTRAQADVDLLNAQLRELNEQLGHNGASSDHQEVEHDTTEVEQTPKTDVVSETTDAEQGLPVDVGQESLVNGSIEFHDVPQSQQDEAVTGEERPSVVDTGPALGDESYEDKEAIEELHHASLPPAEGRNDVDGNTTPPPADTATEPTQEVAEQIPSSEQDETGPVSDTKEDSATDQEESSDTEESPTPRKRSTRPRTTNRRPRQS
jgi:hypothetical protein